MKNSLILLTGFILVGISMSHIIPSENQGEEGEEALNSGKNKDELVFANVIYRHGERSLTGSKELTNTGKKEMFILGEYFHRRYRKLIGKRYSPGKVYTISTDYDRSIMSAEANLAGMFFPREDEMWHDDILWQPVPVHTLPKVLDNILRPRYKDRCPKYTTMYDYYMQKSSYALEMKIKFGKYFEFWQRMSGDEIHTIEDVFSIYKKIIARKDSGEKLESWEKEAIESNGPMDQIAKTVYKIRGLPELVRIRCGFLIKDMLKHFKKKITNEEQFKKNWTELSLYMYSAHSSTITTLLNGLGLDQEEIPDHGSAFLFELYRDKSGDFYLQLFLRMPDEEYPKPKKIPGCGKKCSLEDFYSIYDQLIPGKFKKECRI